MEKKIENAELKAKCEAIAKAKFGDQLDKWQKEYKGLWFLPIYDDEGEVEKIAIMKPITRQILGYASTKITEEGLYAFLEAAMRECMIAGDDEVLEDDEYFIPAANAFNKILEGKKAALLKR